MCGLPYKSEPTHVFICRVYALLQVRVVRSCDQFRSCISWPTSVSDFLQLCVNNCHDIYAESLCSTLKNKF